MPGTAKSAVADVKLYRRLLRETIPAIVFCLAAVKKADARKLLALLRRIEVALGMETD